MKKDDAKIIAMFGGVANLANALNVDRRVVHNWKLRGISLIGRYRIRDYAKQVKIKLPEDFMP